jgi:hypothetical protein
MGRIARRIVRVGTSSSDATRHIKLVTTAFPGHETTYALGDCAADKLAEHRWRLSEGWVVACSTRKSVGGLDWWYQLCRCSCTKEPDPHNY